MRSGTVRVAVVGLLVAVLALGAAGLLVQAQRLPNVVVISTYPVGGAYHAVGSAVAALISQHTPMRAVVQPTGGPNAFVPLLDRNEVQFAGFGAPDVAWAATGGPGYDRAYRNLRMVLVGTQLDHIGLVVREDSGITRVADVRGRAVASGYAANLLAQKWVEVTLRSVGLTWDDVRQVPTPDIFAGLRLLRDGIVDAADGASPATPLTVEVDQAVGLRVLTFADMKPADLARGLTAEQQALIDEYVPGGGVAVFKAGNGILTEDTVLYAYNLIFVTNAQVSEDTVYTVLKTIWERHEELHPAHPWLAQWVPEQMLTERPIVPYHEGAIRFYKEAGVWTAGHERGQEEALRRLR